MSPRSISAGNLTCIFSQRPSGGCERFVLGVARGAKCPACWAIAATVSDVAPAARPIRRHSFRTKELSNANTGVKLSARPRQNSYQKKQKARVNEPDRRNISEHPWQQKTRKHYPCRAQRKLLQKEYLPEYIDKLSGKRSHKPTPGNKSRAKSRGGQLPKADKRRSFGSPLEVPPALPTYRCSGRTRCRWRLPFLGTDEGGEAKTPGKRGHNR